MMGFLQKALKNYASHKHLSRPKPKQVTDARNCFVIEHYAGPVAYNVVGFLQKNKDALPEDVRGVLARSTLPLLAQLMAAEPSGDAGASPRKARGGRGAKKATLGSQFKIQLQSLMTTLNKTEPHFIRCVKPNAEKVGDKFTSEMVLSQLRYAGLLEVCRIRQVGYPVRREFEPFMRLYGACAPGANDIDALLAALVADGTLTERICEGQGESVHAQQTVD